jgi:zinc protease
VQQRTLSNGLTILVQEDHSAPLVCSYIWYRVGLRNEAPGQAGLTHFLEHMAFKGTERFSGREVDRLVTMRGGYLNGFTSMDFTAYVETLPRDALDLAFQIESDRMARCLLKPEDIESEKGVVISEFEGAENDPSFLLRRAVMAAQFPDQPYGRPVIGKKEDLRQLTRETVASYYRRHYAPNNATLVVVGDIKAEDVFAKAQQYFGSIPSSEVSPPAPNPSPGPTGEKRVKLELPGRTSYLQVVYGVPAIGHPDHVALEVLQNIVSGGRTGRLYRALVDTGIASDAGGWDYENPQPTAFAFEISLRPGVKHEQAEQALDAVVERLKAEPVAERELTKAKNQTKAHFIYASDGVTKLGQQIGYYHTLIGYDYLRTFPERVEAVTAEDIQRVASQYFVSENRTVGWLRATGGEGGEAGGPVGAPLDVHGRSAPGRLSGYNGAPSPPLPVPIPPGVGPVPPIREFKLANGLQVILQENHAAPFVTIYGNVMAGPVFERPGKSGLAAFTAEMLSHGTRKRTWSEIQESLEFVAAQLNFGTGTQVGTVSGQCMSGDLALLLEAAAEQLMFPSFPPEEIEKVRSLLIAAQQRRDEDTFQVAERELLRRLYPRGHPLHYSDLGTRETIEGISRDNLADFHALYYRPENTILAIVGDIDPAGVAGLVERAFGGWVRLGEPVRPSLPQVPVPERAAVVRVRVPNKTQTDIAIGFPGLSRRDPDYYQADLMNYLLGRGGFMSRLNLSIREKLGLAYYVWSNYFAYWGPGPWVLHMGVNPANVDKAIDAAVEEIKRIQAEAPSKEEVDLWKDYVEGTVARQMETFGGIAQNLLLASFYELGAYFPYQYPRILRAITPAQVLEAARKRLHPEGYVAVIAGPVGESSK